MRLADEWFMSVRLSAPAACPLNFTDSERARQKEDEAKWSQGVELMAEFMDLVGAYRGWDGWANFAEYEDREGAARKRSRGVLRSSHLSEASLTRTHLLIFFFIYFPSCHHLLLS